MTDARPSEEVPVIRLAQRRDVGKRCPIDTCSTSTKTRLNETDPVQTTRHAPDALSQQPYCKNTTMGEERKMAEIVAIQICPGPGTREEV